MEKIILEDLRINLISVATVIFNEIVNLPKELRPDEKQRTGIAILVREIGTRNLLIIKIHEPSENAQFFSIEKAVRSESFHDYSSQNTENPDRMKFAGSVTVPYDNQTDIQCSVSGLKAEEDTAVAVVLLSFVTGWTKRKVIENIVKKGGALPKCFYDKNHYLYEMIWC